MSTTLNGQKLLGYAVAGGILLMLADIAPKIAVPTTALMLFAVALSHTSQMSALAGWISQTTATRPSNNANVPIIAPPGRRPIL